VRNRQHVNPNAMSFLDFRGEPPRLVPGVPVELEIGCAEAQFLFERAERESDRIYIGLEIREWLVDEVNQQARERGAPVQAIFCNANNHLAQLFPSHSVERVYLNFPDPWFKKRHHKRRMIDEDLAVQIHQVLAPDGELLFQSDVWDVALEVMSIFELLDDRYENVAGEWTFWKKGNPFGVRSWREMHCEEEDLPIWRIRYRPRSAV
jgi:tRNA (guanine-N7-)-methyltransferase